MAVDELCIQPLIACIKNRLDKNRDKFLEQDPVEILETIYQHESFTDLWDYCLKKICEDPEMLFSSDKFIKLEASSLELFLKRDDLNLDEVDIWDSLLKWGLAQNPSISRDIKSWNSEETTIMERTLRRFVPLIKFYLIESEDFLDKVYPLKKSLPEDLINDLIIFHIVPNRKLDIQSPRKYGSTLIQRKHFAVFASWIDKKEELYYDAKNIP